ncbi:MAG: cardiolipin synthase [Pirellulaceae bacterium]
MAEFVAWFFSTVWPYVLASVHVVLTLVASGHVVLTKRDPRAAIGWVGIIWLTPIMGTILYIVLGVNRIRRKARQLRRGRGQRHSSAERDGVSPETIQQILGSEAEHLSALTGYVRKLTGLPLLDGNRVEPLQGGRATYDAMFAAIDAAEKSIGLLTYIFDNDPLGRQFVQALARAQQRGVQVRVLIDSVGARYTWPSIAHALRQAGIPCATFLPTLIPGKLHYTNLRNHRKIMVVDGRIGFTGGINIRAGHLCEPGEKHPVEDLHFRFAGPVVAHLRETLIADWEFSAGEVLEGPAWLPRLEPCGESICRGIADGPDSQHDQIRLTMLGAIGCARHSVEIVTPYFLPEQPMIAALNVAAMRGVAVHILLPSQGNLALVQWASTAQLWQVLERGCRIWLSPKPFDHTKIMLVDGVWSFVGSANWDARSLRLNFEFNVESYDRNLAGQLAHIVHRKRATSRETSLQEVDARPLWMRLRDGVCRLALPYL